jgi:hypothetical protein
VSEAKKTLDGSEIHLYYQKFLDSVKQAAEAGNPASASLLKAAQVLAKEVEALNLALIIQAARNVSAEAERAVLASVDTKEDEPPESFNGTNPLRIEGLDDW